MTRRNALTAALTAPFTMAAAAIAPLRGQKTTPAAAPLTLAAPPVTQSELQAAIDSYNRTEKLVANVRERLESGAGMERGTLGVSTVGAESLAWHRENGGIGECTGLDVTFCGLAIAPIAELQFHVALLQKYPTPAGFVLR